jgi:hypothetical protein
LIVAGRHSLTVQIDPSLPGHLAIVLGDPSGQTYAGFGPEHHLRPYDRGRLDAHPVERGSVPPPDYSSVPGSQAFTFAISEDQARAAYEEIKRVQSEPLQYNALNFRNPQVCTNIASRIMKAAGLGDHLYTVPQVDLEYLSDMADTLANNPRARGAAKSGLPIPDELRGIQPDYADVGTGYDTPSERLGHVPVDSANSLPAVAPSFDTRFETWPSLSNGAMKPETERSVASETGLSQRPVRYLGRMTGTSRPNAFDTGASPAPFMPAEKSPSSSAPPAAFVDRFVGAAPTAQAEQAGRLPGLVSSRPVPDYPVPPQLFGLPDRSAGSGDDIDDWYTRWVKPLIQQ